MSRRMEAKKATISDFQFPEVVNRSAISAWSVRKATVMRRPLALREYLLRCRDDDDCSFLCFFCRFVSAPIFYWRILSLELPYRGVRSRAILLHYWFATSRWFLPSAVAQLFGCEPFSFRKKKRKERKMTRGCKFSLEAHLRSFFVVGASNAVHKCSNLVGVHLFVLRVRSAHISSAPFNHSHFEVKLLRVKYQAVFLYLRAESLEVDTIALI